MALKRENATTQNSHNGHRYGRCEICRGTGQFVGIFHQGACAACNGAGVVLASGESMSLEQAVVYLRTQLTAAERNARQPTSPAASGPEQSYQSNNRRGPGASNYTGD